VTAGASTPNWLIQQVISRLEELGPKKGAGFWLTRALRFLSLSNIYVAFGAACLSYACCRLQGIEPRLTFEFIAGFYIFAMHLLNHFTDRAVTYNEPARVEFYDRYRWLLIGLGIASIIGALLVAGFLGLIPFLFLLGMTGLGILYRVNIVPRSLNLHYRRISDIPASKDTFLALAWAVVLVVLHLISANERFSLATLVAFGFSLGLAFTRSVIYSIRDLQGDLIVGRETIPMIFGIDRTRRLLAGVGIGVVLLLLVGAGLGWTSSLGYWLIGIVVYAGLYQWLFYQRKILPGGWAELVIDTSFILAGAIAYLWYLCQA
jgi:4-hydroxy-3-methylbut-2-enyl diphosphate reductase